MTTNYCDNNLPFFPRQLFISIAIVPYSQIQENKKKKKTFYFNGVYR